MVYLDPHLTRKKITASIGSSAEGGEFSDIFREEDIKYAERKIQRQKNIYQNTIKKIEKYLKEEV